MQPEQQLQWKRSQAQTRLLSRKRKLAELFSVTASESVDDYKTKLQSFHDANDLERGRLFDEATLPPRIHITRIRQKLQTKQLSHSPTRVLPISRRSKSPRKQDVRLSPKPSEKFSIPIKSPPLSSDAESIIDTSSDIENEVRKKHVTKDSDVRERKTAVQPRVNGIDGDRVEDLNFLSPRTQTKTTPSPKHSDRDVSFDSGPARESSPPAKDHRTASVKARRSRSPLAFAPTTNNKDTQPAHTSTTDLATSNTPVPAITSPETRPEDEKHTPTSSESIPGKPLDADSLGRGKRPETPDSTQTLENHDPSLSSIDIDMADPPALLDETSPTEDAEKSTLTKDKPSNSKPSMRVDTQTDVTSYFLPQTMSGLVESPATATASTPHRPPPTPSMLDSTKRATRISSGVLQKKSVSEILGEVPKTAHSQLETPVISDALGGFNVLSSQDRTTDRDRRDKERSKLSTVVFTKPQKTNADGDTIELARSDARESHKVNGSDRDYLYTLFENKAYSMTRQGSLGHLIQNAHKTLSTADHLVEYQLQAECRLLKRLYQLQEKQRWPLRQYKRVEEAPRPTSHWDFVLDHAKWMRTDFREERKWKLAAARGLAECCAEWVASPPERRKVLQVAVKPPKLRESEEPNRDVEMEEGPGPALSSQPTPDLIPSNEDDSVTDELAEPTDLPVTVPPAAIFSLGASDFNFTIDRTPAFDKLLNELPIYEPAQLEPDLAKSKLAEKFDSRWKTDIVPVSRFAIEKLRVQDYRVHAKRSRYDYDIETTPSGRSVSLPPQDTNVALFMPENKHIRDRIHPGHSFRPPSEYPMPTQAFFETRSSSQWTQAEDDELRKLVKDYSYNWSLISGCLTPRSLYISGADRRTPWECFERWIGLEGLPADMSKTPYFKTYSGRIEAAGRHVQAQIEEAQRRAGANVQIATRKRTTQPVRVERKRTQRHLAMLDAMRKLAKKRESALQKQQHQADLAAMRKVNEVNQPKAPFSKPSEFAALKLEREQKLAERQEIYRQQLIAHQRATAQAQRGQNAQPNGVPNGVPPANSTMRVPAANALPGAPNGNLQVPNGHARLAPPMMAMPNGMQMPQGMAVPKNIAQAQAQAQMQANMARGMAASPEQIRMLQQANKVQQEQLMRQAQQAQNGNHSSPIGSAASLANVKGVNNPAYMAALAMANGVSSPAGPMNGTSGSPRAQASTTGQALSSGHVPVLTQIANKIREQFPHMSDDEVQKAASQQIQAWQQQATTAAVGQAPKRPQPHNQAAVNAAMGAVNAAAHASNAAAAAAAAAAQYNQQGMMTNEQVQQYNQRMRMHQAQQHAARGLPGQMPPGMVASMSNSPAMTMARPVSQQTNQGQMSRSATPRDQRSNSQGNSNGVIPGQQGSPRPGSQQTMQT